MPYATQVSDTGPLADLSLHWAHMSFCWFCHEVAHNECVKKIYELCEGGLYLDKTNQNVCHRCMF